MNADIAHAAATTAPDSKRQLVNEALYDFDAALRKERAQAVLGHAWGTLAWAWREEARVVGETLRRLGAA